MSTSKIKAQENGDGLSPAGTSESGSSLTFPKQLRRRLAADIDTKWGDVILIWCFFCAGLIDSMAFNVYSCFVSMQTGNTIFIGLGVSGLPANSARYSWTKSLIALLCFAAGALFFANFHRILSPIKRGVLVGSFAIQTILIIVTAILVATGAVSDHKLSQTATNATATTTAAGSPETFPWADFAPIALLAFQSAGQIVASRVLMYNAIPTVVVTSLLCDLMSDPHLFTAGLFEDANRNRRAVSLVFLFLGAMLGGFLAKSPVVGFAGALWIAAGIKGVMALAWLLWREKKKTNPVGVNS